MMRTYKGWEIHESNWKDHGNQYAKYWIRRKGFGDEFTQAPKFRTIELAKQAINNIYGAHKVIKSQ